MFHIRWASKTEFFSYTKFSTSLMNIFKAVSFHQPVSPFSFFVTRRVYWNVLRLPWNGKKDATISVSISMRCKHGNIRTHYCCIHNGTLSYHSLQPSYPSSQLPSGVFNRLLPTSRKCTWPPFKNQLPYRLPLKTMNKTSPCDPILSLGGITCYCCRKHSSPCNA